MEVTKCFAGPHVECGDEVAIGKDFNKQMLALHVRANPKEVVVGWYASAALGEDGAKTDLIADMSSLIHEFYAGELDEGDPIHLVVDTTRLCEDSIAKFFNHLLQDLLMVTYLSNITRTQLSIAEKLNASLGI